MVKAIKKYTNTVYKSIIIIVTILLNKFKETRLMKIAGKICNTQYTLYSKHLYII